MNKLMKKQIEEILNALKKIHLEIKEKILNNEMQYVLACLEECQSAAISIGNQLEKLGEGCKTVHKLEEYCEYVYNIYNDITIEKEWDISKSIGLLNQQCDDIKKCFSMEIIVKKEIVFLPYKASMWDSLESIWKDMIEKSDYEVNVVPIPYYDKNSDGSLGKYHYEGKDYPTYVPVIDYNSYNFEQNRPDEIYIHNPYDEYNYVTSVHPFFYSYNLKKYTEKLIYVPYYILREPDLYNKNSIKKIEQYINVSAVFNADKVLVQSENMKKCYIQILTEEFGKETQKQWERKISFQTSPKIIKIQSMNKSNLDIPRDWKRKITTPNGKNKKVLLYNTGVKAFLENSDKMIKKIDNVLSILKNQEDIALLWRPHPLLEVTIASMRPDLYKRYKEIVQKYLVEDWGIYDESSDVDRAIILSDAYYGDPSSVVQLCRAVNKKVMIQNVNILLEL